MSRLIVKNLPDKIKETRLRELFTSQGGEITDIKLCHTKKGVFRKFGFVGFKSEEEAVKALQYFDKSFIDTSKIQVEVCKNLGDQTVPRPWSKYSKGSSQFSKKSADIEKRKKLIQDLQKGSEKQPKEEETKSEEVEDEGFKEFLAVHENKGTKKAWTNENLVSLAEEKKPLSKKQQVQFEEDSEADDSENEDSPTDKVDVEISEDVLKEQTTKCSDQKSDLDWLRSKTTKTSGESSTSKESTEKHIDQPCAKENSKDEDSMEVETAKIKMRGIPFKCSEKDVVKFFKPLAIDDIRFPLNKKGKPSGYSFVDFRTVNDAKEALKRNKRKMQGRYIELFTVEDAPRKNYGDKWKDKEPAEDVTDTGRLFVRNLSYTITEESITQLFSKYGDLVEVNLPIDKNSNRSTGYAFVTFVMADHALRALNELDGSIFEGRILHILPGQAKKTKEDEDKNKGLSSYQREKEKEKKSLVNSAHNWNTLFLGANVVADVMSSRLNTTKSGLLETTDTTDNKKAGGSVAVRMALGETELVAETRHFLEEYGVKLDSFGQAKCTRSKTVLLVKNLPTGTLASELEAIFSEHGAIGRILMPPFGITAIVEFAQPSDAKKAFNNLAYSKFKHTPLYLEWAPMDVLSGEVKTKEEKMAEENESEDEKEGGSGAVLFVKNLNFDTTEEKLKEYFSGCGPVTATVAKKQNPKQKGSMLSMGYGFLEFKKVGDAEKAITLLQNSELDGHKLELKKSNRESIAPKSSRKRAAEGKQTSSKIIVRNIPFEANQKEVKELFSTFGHIKSLRLPKKLSGAHRGFAFIDFTTKQEAKRAFTALCQSTHLYGRRLVLEWAEGDDSVEMLRKKTAEHFREGEPSAKRTKSDLQNALGKTKRIVDDEE